MYFKLIAYNVCIKVGVGSLSRVIVQEFHNNLSACFNSGGLKEY